MAKEAGGTEGEGVDRVAVDRAAVDRGGVDRERLFDALPVPVLIVGADGTLLDLNEKATELVAGALGDMIGTSIADWLHPDDLAEAFMSLEWSTTFTDSTTGPIRMRHVDAKGNWVPADIWSRTAVEDPSIGGMVVVATEPTARFAIADAVGEIARGQPVEQTLLALSQAVEWRPFWDEGFFVLVDVEGFSSLSKRSFPVALTPEGGLAGPWVQVFTEGKAVRVPREDLPADMAVVADEAGYTSAWGEPVFGADGETVVSVLIVWRRRPINPSPNHLRHLEEIASTASLAFTKRSMEERLARAAVSDPLTGLANRAGFYEALAQSRSGGARALLYVDLDGFKEVNDTLGHQAGDEVLKEIASRLLATVRAGDKVSRLGGDEFAVVCNAMSSVDDAGAVADHVIEVVSRPIETGAGPATVGASIGIAMDNPAVNDEALVEVADRALYEAKRNGKGAWRLGRPLD